MSDAPINLSIEGMMCGSCVSSVENALRAVPGVEGVSVSLEDKSALVKGEVQIDALIQAVKQAGYTATQ